MPQTKQTAVERLMQTLAALVPMTEEQREELEWQFNEAVEEQMEAVRQRSLPEW